MSVRTFLKIACAVLIWAGCLIRISATTLDDYRTRLSRSLSAIQQLQIDESKGDRSAETAIFAQLRAELPPHENLVLPGQTVAVDNTWLRDALNDYEKAKADKERKDLLVGMGEYLLAIIQRVDDLQRATGMTDKDESKARLAEILRRPEYNQTAAEGSALQRLWEAFIRWISKLFPRRKPMQPGSAQVFSRIAQVVVIGFSVAAIVFLIWKFAPRYFRNRGKKKKKREARIVLGERLEPDQTAGDLLEQAESLARSGDLRAAIRKAYIALLCELGDRKILSLAQHKTNRDYLAAVRTRAPLFNSMKQLTNSFELHWYGFVPAAEHDWSSFRAGYQQALAAGRER
jgi:Domain of unknown function (DUF4129)